MNKNYRLFPWPFPHEDSQRELVTDIHIDNKQIYITKHR